MTKPDEEEDNKLSHKHSAPRPLTTNEENQKVEAERLRLV